MGDAHRDSTIQSSPFMESGRYFGDLGGMTWRSTSLMSRSVWIVIALLAFVYTLWPRVPAFAAYGAIAWDRGTGKYGASWNQPTPQRAAEVALSECGATSCKVVT